VVAGGAAALLRGRHLLEQLQCDLAAEAEPHQEVRRRAAQVLLNDCAHVLCCGREVVRRVEAEARRALAVAAQVDEQHAHVAIGLGRRLKRDAPRKRPPVARRAQQAVQEHGRERAALLLSTPVLRAALPSALLSTRRHLG
jgi:hypothetical protein